MIAETFQTLELHTHRANQAYDEVMGFAALMDVETLNDFDKVKVIDSFIFRFIKIQEALKVFHDIRNIRENMFKYAKGKGLMSGEKG